MAADLKNVRFTGGVTPVCSECMVHLCWDISEEEYYEEQEFWDAWICKDCNGGESLSLKYWIKNKNKYI